ncbi:MAG: Pvc16 family protein [Burkholderiaceae bacterium]
MHVAPVTGDDGQWAVPADSLGLTLFQIDEERPLRGAPAPERLVLGGREIAMPPELRLNATLLVSARYADYQLALRRLTQVLGFFHGRPLFTPADSPSLPAGIDRLSMDLLSHGPEQTHQLWACLGARHLPSVVYRLRMVLMVDPPSSASAAPALPADAALGAR